MCPPAETCDLVPSLQNIIMCQTHSRVPKCDGRLIVQIKSDPINRMVTAPSGVQAGLSKWFTLHIDLFATRLNHKVLLCVSPVPDQQAWEIDALNINWFGLIAYIYPPMALLHRVIQKIRQCSVS